MAWEGSAKSICHSGYTKYSCFLCLWNSRADSKHYKKIHWLTWEKPTLGIYNVIGEPLVCRKKILLRPLQVKLGLVKQIGKALEFEEVFQENHSMFPRQPDAKIKREYMLAPR